MVNFNLLLGLIKIIKEMQSELLKANLLVTHTTFKHMVHIFGLQLRFTITHSNAKSR